MRTLKKALSLVLVLAMVFALAVPGFAANTTKKASDFKDYSKVTNKEAVDVLTAIGVINGNTDGTFGPEGNFTRAQAASIVAHMVLGNGADALTKAATSFSDVPATHWASGYIQYCVGEGILNGYGNGKFGPDDTLTATQWALMLLGALGYKASNEGIGGNGWEVATTKLAIQAGVASADELTGTFNRDMAAKMAFNTLTATMVQYSSGTNVSTSDGTTITINATRSKVEHDTRSGYKASGNDGYTQFCEQYCGKLKLTAVTVDSLNRPANNWAFANKAIGAYAKAATLTYTSNLNTTAGKKTVKADLSGYTTTLAGYTTVGGALDTDKVAAETGNGVLVEIYVTDNEITNIVVTETKLVTVKKITKDEVSFAGETLKVSKNEALYSFVSGLNKDDKVIITKDAAGSKIVDAYEPTYVTGIYTKVNNGAYTVGGTAYQVAKDVDISATLGDTTNLLKTYTLTLDKYGYIVAVGNEKVTESTYAFVLDTSYSVNRGTYDVAAKLLFADGTTKWVDLSKVGGQSVADGKVNSTAVSGLKENYVSYTVAEDKYAVSAVASGDQAKTAGAITKGNSTILDANLTASNTTVFVVEGKNGYTVYTGIKNVPSMSVAANSAFVLKDGTVAKIVVVTKSSTTSNADQVFIYNTTATGTEKIDGVVVNYYKALVNGEDTTIGVKDGETVAVALYVNNSYTGDYISTLGTKYNAGTADSTSIFVYNFSDDGLSDITLKNGVLTVDKTTDVTKIVAEEFNSYIVKTTGADTLSLSTKNTFGADGSENVTFAAGDYAVAIVDSNGYVTALYVVDVA